MRCKKLSTKIIAGLFLFSTLLSACSQEPAAETEQTSPIIETVGNVYADPVLCEVPISLTADKTGTVRLHGKETSEYFYGISNVEIIWRDGSATSFSTMEAMRDYWADVPSFDTGYTQAPLTDGIQDGGIQLEDFNFDGYTDIGLQAQVPAYNQPYVYWFYSPDTGEFLYHGNYICPLVPDAESQKCTVNYHDGQDYYTDYYDVDESHNLVLCQRDVTQYIEGKAFQHTEYFTTEIDNITEQSSTPNVTVPSDTVGLPDSRDFVRVADYIPDIVCELPYASTNNFTGKVIYDFQDAYLRYGTVQKLSIVQDALREYGFSIKIWDAYRPQWAQVWLWNICPDPVYVSNPYQGKRTHCRGNTVDVTLVDMDGNEIPMPSGFDDFSARADRDYSDCTSEQGANSQLLESVMVHAGFKPYSGEWWHYTDEEDYDLELVFTPGEPMIWQPDCKEYITLRETPNTSATAITTIPKGEYFVILEWCDPFAFVDYHGQTGYVHTDYIMPLS